MWDRVGAWEDFCQHNYLFFPHCFSVVTCKKKRPEDVCFSGPIKVYMINSIIPI